MITVTINVQISACSRNQQPFYACFAGSLWKSVKFSYGTPRYWGLETTTIELYSSSSWSSEVDGVVVRALTILLRWIIVIGKSSPIVSWAERSGIDGGWHCFRLFGNVMRMCHYFRWVSRRASEPRPASAFVPSFYSRHSSSNGTKQERHKDNITTKVKL